MYDDPTRKRTILVTRADTRKKHVIPIWNIVYAAEPRDRQGEGPAGVSRSSVVPLPTKCIIVVKGYGSDPWPLAETLEVVHSLIEGA